MIFAGKFACTGHASQCLQNWHSKSVQSLLYPGAIPSMICSFFAVALYSFENGRKITHFFTNRQIFFNFSFLRSGNADQIYFPQTDIQPCFKFDYCYLLAKFAIKSNFYMFFACFLLYGCSRTYCFWSINISFTLAKRIICEAQMNTMFQRWRKWRIVLRLSL